MNHFRSHLRKDGFSLVELLVVLTIIGIIAAIASPLVPSLLKGNQVDSSVATLAGILEEARETATASNTYIWVAFTDPLASSPGKGIWVATLQSLDGTESIVPNSTATTLSALPTPMNSPLTIPSAADSNIALHSAVVNLPGVQVITAISSATTLQSINTAITTSANAKTPAGPVPPAYPSAATSLLDSLNWTLTTLQKTGLSVTFTHAIEFTPNGEAHVTSLYVASPSWYSNIQFALAPAAGGQTNYALYNVTRLTGKATVFRM